MKKVFSEQELESYFTRCVRLAGAITFKFIPLHFAGIPDRIVICRGMVYFVELKSSCGRLREIQRLRFDQFRRHGVSVLVINSREGVDDFVIRLSEKSR